MQEKEAGRGKLSESCAGLSASQLAENENIARYATSWPCIRSYAEYVHTHLQHDHIGDYASRIPRAHERSLSVIRSQEKVDFGDPVRDNSASEVRRPFT